MIINMPNNNKHCNDIGKSQFHRIYFNQRFYVSICLFFNNTKINNINNLIYFNIKIKQVSQQQTISHSER